MRKVFILFGVLLWVITLTAQSQVIITSNQDPNVQYLSGYYGVPPQTVVMYQNQLGSWQDVAASLFLAKVTKMSPERIVALRQGGLPYATIANQYNVPPSVFYVPPIDSQTVVVQGPPYGKAWGYWKKHGPKRVTFTDEQFENRAALLSTSRYYGVPVNTEFRLVQGGTPFTTIIRQNERRRRHSENGQGKHGNGNNGRRNEGNNGRGNHGNNGEGKHEHGDKHGD